MIHEKKQPNHLISEKSPYLLQHSYNPVNWYPWGEEAFSKAKAEDKPIFLSIGYSTCHWCHVMEQESFEDEEVASLLNENFIAIKVDREERPDIDAIYMSVCQALTGAGGWPLTILMTQEQKPFFAGTYLPKHRRYDNMGLMMLLSEVAKLWKTQRNQLLKTGEDITAYVKKQGQSYQEASMPSKKMLTTAMAQFQQVFDDKYGGFGTAPKFPTPHNILFLLQFSVLEQNKTALDMAEKTLVQMYRGGIFDHIGGGFSRYSTDEKWMIPHFEKMLYDNALLAMAYLEAFRVTKKPFYEMVARRTLDYILKELTHEEGGFYCGQDADSDGVEGKYYVLTPEEVYQVLGEEQGALFCQWFGITKEGNFEGKSIPHLLNTKGEDLPSPAIQESCKKLFSYRLSRTKLHKDDKILNSWNALAIAAFSQGFRILQEPRYLLAAQKAAHFVKNHLTKPDGSLLVRWREQQSAHTGNLEDYAFYAYGLLALYDASFDVSYLKEAIEVAEKMVTLFEDKEKGGFYLYSIEAEPLISRPKELFDGAMPAGNSVAAAVLVRLAALTGEPLWQEREDRQLGFLAGNAQDYPLGHSFTLLAMAQSLFPSSELICVWGEKMPISELHHFMNRCVMLPSVLVKTLENERVLSKIVPLTKAYAFPQQGESYYLCTNGACLPPATQLGDIEQSKQVTFIE